MCRSSEWGFEKLPKQTRVSYKLHELVLINGFPVWCCFPALVGFNAIQGKLYVLRCCFGSYLWEWSMHFICPLQSWQRKHSSWWPLPSVRITAWILGLARETTCLDPPYSPALSLDCLWSWENCHISMSCSITCRCKVVLSVVGAVFVSPDCALVTTRPRSWLYSLGVVDSSDLWYTEKCTGGGSCWWVESCSTFTQTFLQI